MLNRLQLLRYSVDMFFRLPSQLLYYQENLPLKKVMINYWNGYLILLDHLPNIGMHLILKLQITLPSHQPQPKFKSQKD